MNIVGVVCVHGRNKACGVQEFKKKLTNLIVEFKTKICKTVEA
jgi:hypothetical protein